MKRRKKTKFKYDVTNLVEARMLKRWPLGRLALEVGVTANYLWMIENGKRRLTEKLAFKMSEKLEVPMDKVLVRGGHAA